MTIGTLTHVAIGADDLDASLSFYRELLGVVEVARTDSTVYLSGGKTAAYDIAIGPWPTGLHHIAFEADDLDEPRARLERAGVELEEVGAEPGIVEGIRFVLPSGHLVELVVLAEPSVFQPLVGIDAQHFEGVGPVQLEHVSINLDDVEETVGFLGEHLGFRVTEASRREGSPWFLAFVRTRDLHHDLGLFRNHRGDTLGPGLDHYGFAVPSVEHLVQAADIARRLGHFLQCSIGRHVAGDNVFLYLLDPSGIRIEIGTPLATIDPAAPPRIFEARSDAEWLGVFDAWREGIPPAVRTPNPCFDGRIGAQAGAG